MLILRELLGGPARFRELQEGLPGIAKNLLTSRLRRLESDGVVRRAHSAVSTQYTLTEDGAALRPTIEALGMWGARFAGEATHVRSVRATAVALHAILSRRADVGGVGPRLVVELEIDGEPLEILLGPRVAVTARPSTDADARARVSSKALASFLAGKGLAARRVQHLSGQRAATDALVTALRGE